MTPRFAARRHISPRLRDARFRAIRQNSADSRTLDLVSQLEESLRELDRSQHEVLKLQRLLLERSEDTEVLRRIGEATGSAVALEPMLKVAADVAISVTDTDSCQVYLYDRVREELVLRAADNTASNMLGKIRLKIGEGLTGWVARERRPVAIPINARNDPRFKFFAEIHEEEYEAILSVPLLQKGDIIGVINVRTKTPHAWTKREERLLSGIASQVAGAIEKTRQARNMVKTSSQLISLSEVSEAFAGNAYIDQMLNLFVEMVARTMDYKICTVLLVDPIKNELTLKATQSQNADYVRKPRPRVGQSIAGKSVEEQRIITVLDVRKRPEYAFPEIAKSAGITSLACVPLMSRGKAIGVLNCYTEKIHHFTKEELAILRSLSTQAAFAVENSKLTVKSAIIQEMHHRVKNNLQQIASLVRLQSRFSNVNTANQALNDTLNRILAIAAVHELLSRDDLDSVSITKVTEQILVGTKQSVVPPGKSVYMAVDGPDIHLPLHLATSLALVINELVQNAVEHGFKQLERGRIAVHLSETEGKIMVQIFNDGESLPEGFDPVQAGSLGLKIVSDLVRNGLSGSFSMENREGGITATVTFRRPD